jgi:hypothetical protein
MSVALGHGYLNRSWLEIKYHAGYGTRTLKGAGFIVTWVKICSSYEDRDLMGQQKRSAGTNIYSNGDFMVPLHLDLPALVVSRPLPWVVSQVAIQTAVQTLLIQAQDHRRLRQNQN